MTSKTRPESTQIRNSSQNPDLKVPKISTRQSFKWRWKLAFVGLTVLGTSFWLRLGTIQGVPVSIVWTFLTDDIARDAYFNGQKKLLHDRLNDLGVEEEIAAYYRPQFDDEAELDLFIHQLMYDRTGYVGKSYKLGANDTLVLKTLADRQFPRWIELAKGLDLVQSHHSRDGIIYIVTSDGATVSYPHFSKIYTLRILRQMSRHQKRQRR